MPGEAPLILIGSLSMSSFDRRLFLKGLFATAASSAPASPLLRHPSSTLAADTTVPAVITLDVGEQQLRVSKAPLTFQNFLRTGTIWKAATLPSSLIIGASFDLQLSDARRDGDRLLLKGRGEAKGLEKNSVEYEWNSEIWSQAESGGNSWIRFRTTLDLPAPIQLQNDMPVEPQLITWLSSTSALMEGQSGSWRRVLLEQPTRNSLGTFGNDLPALYLLDQAQGVETLMYFDVEEMGWMSTQNLPRFLVYRCSSVTRVDQDRSEQLGVGWIAAQSTGNVLPKGQIRFSHRLLQRPVSNLLTPQEASTRWMEALLPLFEERLTWPACATSWREYAAGTVKDLQEKGSAEVSADGQTGLRAYVKASSQIWKETADNFELMTLADVLWPSLLYLKVNPSETFAQECQQLLASLPSFYHGDTHSIGNDFKRGSDERADSWYPFENGLIKYPMIARLAGSKDLADNFLQAFERTRELAHQYNYLFPIYYRVATLKQEGAGTNYAVGGLYAWSAILAHRLSGKEEHLEEARRTVQVLYTVPVDRLFHEPQELGFAALAAAELGKMEEAQYFLHQQLRMFYWYSDPSQKSHDIRGMVQACASILYPAFKENVEAILPWTGVMKRGLVFDGLLRFMDQQRRNNFYFFENCSAETRAKAMAFIPFENLSTLELGGKTGSVGKEIYGAGESLWMYLMFEALGSVSDRELMLVNLDLLDSFNGQEFPPRKLTFILFNPHPDTRTATLSIPNEKDAHAKWSIDGKGIGDTIQIAGGGTIRLVAELEESR